MRARRSHAIEDLNKMKRRFVRHYRFLLTLIDEMLNFQGRVTSYVKRELRVIMQDEVSTVWERGCVSMKRKVRHLREKWSKRQVTVSEGMRGIAISDYDLDVFCERGGLPEQGLEPSRTSVDPPLYGGSSISGNQKSILSLPPKFTTYEQISDTAMEVEMEVMNCKLRWEMMSRDERGGEEWSEGWEMQRLEREREHL